MANTPADRSADYERTHYVGCWRIHHDCAVALLERIVGGQIEIYHDDQGHPRIRTHGYRARIDGSLRPVCRACLDGHHDECTGTNSAGTACTCDHNDGYPSGTASNGPTSASEDKS